MAVLRQWLPIVKGIEIFLAVVAHKSFSKSKWIWSEIGKSLGDPN